MADTGDVLLTLTGAQVKGDLEVSGTIRAGKNIEVNGNVVVNGPDVTLDASGRRLYPDGGRRALVHDFDDRLTINYDRDYPNGVQIRGSLVVDRLFVRETAGFGDQITTSDLVLGTAVEPPIVRPNELPPGVSTWGLTPFNIRLVIQDLQSEIQQLKNKVEALESKA